VNHHDEQDGDFTERPPHTATEALDNLLRWLLAATPPTAFWAAIDRVRTNTATTPAKPVDTHNARYFAAEALEALHAAVMVLDGRPANEARAATMHDFSDEPIVHQRGFVSSDALYDAIAGASHNIQACIDNTDKRVAAVYDTLDRMIERSAYRTDEMEGRLRTLQGSVTSIAAMVREIASRNTTNNRPQVVEPPRSPASDERAAMPLFERFLDAVALIVDPTRQKLLASDEINAKAIIDAVDRQAAALARTIDAHQTSQSTEFLDQEERLDGLKEAIDAVHLAMERHAAEAGKGYHLLAETRTLIHTLYSRTNQLEAQIQRLTDRHDEAMRRIDAHLAQTDHDRAQLQRMENSIGAIQWLIDPTKEDQIGWRTRIQTFERALAGQETERARDRERHRIEHGRLVEAIGEARQIAKSALDRTAELGMRVEGGVEPIDPATLHQAIGAETQPATAPAFRRGPIGPDPTPANDAGHPTRSERPRPERAASSEAGERPRTGPA
jgi:hypothetical protein